jgi:hypothetical protein
MATANVISLCLSLPGVAKREAEAGLGEDVGDNLGDALESVGDGVENVVDAGKDAYEKLANWFG